MTEHWYSNRSQIYWTCRALVTGRTISTLDEIGEVRGWRLGAIVHTLRTQYDWPILTDHRGPDRIGHYRLSQPCNALALKYPRSARDVREEVAAQTARADDDAAGSAHG